MSEDLKELFEQARFLREHRIEMVAGPDGQPVPIVLTKQGAAPIKNVLDAYRTTPERTTGAAALATLASLIDHARRFKSPHTVAFCEAARPSISVVYDYDGADAPRWRKHRAHYAFPFSREWKAWTAADDVWMEQGEFAAFLEDHAADVVAPSEAQDAAAELQRIEIKAALPSQILAASKGLDVTATATVTNRVNLANGGVRLVFDEEIKSAAEIPGGFVIAVPMFDGDTEATAVPVRLRMRVEKSAIKWGIALLHADKAVREAVDESVATFTEETGVPVLYGLPE